MMSINGFGDNLFGHGAVSTNNHENKNSILPLPLNLIALIISYVSGGYINDAHPLTIGRLRGLQTSLVRVAHAEFSIT